MKGANEHLRGLARRIVDAALERVPLRAALLVGSAGRGDADLYSDLDLLLYVDELPAEEILAEIREAVGGTNPIRREKPTEHYLGEEFELDGVRTEATTATRRHRACSNPHGLCGKSWCRIATMTDDKPLRHPKLWTR